MKAAAMTAGCSSSTSSAAPRRPSQIRLHRCRGGSQLSASLGIHHHPSLATTRVGRLRKYCATRQVGAGVAVTVGEANDVASVVAGGGEVAVSTLVSAVAPRPCLPRCSAPNITPSSEVSTRRW
jgi:hypothetical protein